MEDRRLARLAGEGEVPAQVRPLGVDRAEDAVVVEAGLADRDDALVGGQRDDAVPAGAVDLGRVVRVDADTDVEPRETRRERERPLARCDVPARDEHPLDAGQPRAAEDEVGVALEAVGLEVAVAVDQAHRTRSVTPAAGSVASASRSRRGKSGSGAVTRPASVAWAPQRSSARSGGPPFPSGPYGKS